MIKNYLVQLKKHQFKIYGMLAVLTLITGLFIRFLVTGEFQVLDPENPFSNAVLFICRLVIYTYLYVFISKKLSNKNVNNYKRNMLLLLAVYEFLIVGYIPETIYNLIGGSL